MSRRATILCCLALATLGLPQLPAAPVPKHLMPKETPFVFPTTVGTKWVYETDGGEVVLVISKVEDSEGGKLITIEQVPEGRPRRHHMTYLVHAKGVFLAAELGEAYDAPWCLLKLPHKDGEEWETKPARKGRVLVNGKRKAGPVEKVKTSAGEFTAVRVEWDIGTSRATHWYAHGIGLVRQDGGTKRKLKSFTPAKE